jgi:predicted nucleic acid-binding protein
MRLIVDTSVLVGELLRVAGRQRLSDQRIDLFLPERMAGELSVELPRRISRFIKHRGLPPAVGDELAAACRAAVDTAVVVLDEAVYSALEDEARARTLRDPADWPVVASALALSAAIWTNDNDFLGTGIATWTTESLSAWLDRHPDDESNKG